MATNDSVIKEIKSNLESAQKELLKEINTQKNPLQRLFASGQSTALKAVQSCIAKALNQLGNLTSSGSQNVAKIQANLSQKDTEIKSLEEKLKSSEDAKFTLEGKITFLENQAKELDKKLKEEQLKTKEAHESNREAQILENKESDTTEFENKIQKLNETNKDLVDRCKQREEELREAQNIAAEINTRLKRFKSEVLAK